MDGGGGQMGGRRGCRVGACCQGRVDFRDPIACFLWNVAQEEDLLEAKKTQNEDHKWIHVGVVQRDAVWRRRRRRVLASDPACWSYVAPPLGVPWIWVLWGTIRPPSVRHVYP